MHIVKHTFLLFLLLTLFSHAFSKPLIMAADPYPPSTIVEEIEGKHFFSGIDVDIVTEIARRMNLELVIESCPFVRCLKLLEHGRADITGSLLKRPDREVYLHYLEQAYKNKSKKAFYVGKNSNHTIKKYEDLYPLEVAVVRGYRYFSEFDNDLKLKKFETDSTLQALKMIAQGRTDVFISSEDVADYTISENKLRDRIKKTDFYKEKQTKSYITISKMSAFATRLDDFNRVQNEMILDGTIERIKQHYFEKFGLK